MKVRDLIHELDYFNDNDEIVALYRDKEKDVEYECNIEVDGDEVFLVILEKKEEKDEN
ncbi:MAG: hypothetical protein E7J62_05640 [Serratia marcescens]|jgi:hypothetical protein|nr:hypothetical protein [Serratia marcescens]